MNMKMRQGTTAWFEMAEQMMLDAAANAGLATDLNFTLIERYTDGTMTADGLLPGIRFDIVNGRSSFRTGVHPDERGDVPIEITSAAARTLNLLRSADPEYQRALQHMRGSGEMRVDGDSTRLGHWLEAVHDPIVDRTE